MTDDENRLLAALPEDGKPVTNPELQRKLGWMPEYYWKVRNALVEGGEEVVEPLRFDPDPRRLNDFLSTQFDHSHLETILRWFR